MSFEAPYSRFTPGDLVYGLPDGRARLIDVFRSRGWCTGRTEVLEVDALDGSAAAPAALLPALHEFRDVVRAHPKYGEALDPSHPREFRQRTLAKAGLYWATLVAGRNVHYSLAGLDSVTRMRAIAGKSAPGEDIPVGGFDGTRDAPLTRYTKSRSGVGAELRWIFRHQNVPAVRARIQFWRPRDAPPGEASETSALHVHCPPPWEWDDESGAAWQAYRPKRFHSPDDYEEGQPI
jgi:hypothetical protein